MKNNKIMLLNTSNNLVFLSVLIGPQAKDILSQLSRLATYFYTCECACVRACVRVRVRVRVYVWHCVYACVCVLENVRAFVRAGVRVLW